MSEVWLDKAGIPVRTGGLVHRRRSLAHRSLNPRPRRACETAPYRRAESGVPAAKDRSEDDYDPWNDPEFNDKSGRGRSVRCPAKGRNMIYVSVDLGVPLNGTSRETELHMALNARGTKALLKNPYLVQQFLEPSLRSYRPGRSARCQR